MYNLPCWALSYARKAYQHVRYAAVKIEQCSWNSHIAPVRGHCVATTRENRQDNNSSVLESYNVMKAHADNGKLSRVSQISERTTILQPMQDQLVRTNFV